MRELNKSNDLAEAIKNVLRKRNITRPEFARLMGEDITVVGKWLSGTHNFTLPTLLDISMKLELI